MSSTDNLIYVLFLLFLLDEKNPNINIFVFQDVYNIGVLEKNLTFVYLNRLTQEGPVLCQLYSFKLFL